MEKLAETPNGRYYLYVDESGNFNDTDNDDNRNGSLIGGVLCWDETRALEVAKKIIATVREKYVKKYPEYDRFSFYHATEFPDQPHEKAAIKRNIKFDMLKSIIDNDYGFIPIVFSQAQRVHIQDPTTTYIMFLVDGLVKLIQDCTNQKDFNLNATLGGMRDIARTNDYIKRHNGEKPPKNFYIPKGEIITEFNKYMAMAQVREQYSFRNKFTVAPFCLDDDHQNELLVLSDYVANTFLTLRHPRHGWAEEHKKYGKKIHVYQIAEEPNVERLKRYTADGNYSMALFYAMASDEDTDEYKTFKENFKFAIQNMSTVEKEIVLNHYGQLLKRLLEMSRKSEEVIKQIDRAMKYIGGDTDTLGECQNEFVANMRLYKLTAITHLGKVKQFQNIDAKCSKSVKESGNLELYIIFVNRLIVHSQDTFEYDESLRLGGTIIDLIDELLKPLDKFNEENGTNFTIYKDQYFRLCGSLALTCYFTLNNSKKYLELARSCSDIAINGFTHASDKQRQYQIRAQIEAEVGNFDFACEMLDAGLNITIKNPQAEQFKNFSAFDWYHFSKFTERLLSSKNEEYFEIAKNALKVSRDEFLNYRRKKTAPLEHPDYITFSKMATCFDIIGDKSIALDFNTEAIQGVDSEIGEDKTEGGKTIYAIAVNANAAAFRLVMSANLLLTLEKNNMTDKAKNLINKMKNDLNEYLTRVNIESMKVPFDGWKEAIEHIKKNPDDKIDIIEDMSRAILL